MRIDLLRHGEPIGGVRIRGQLDDPLSDAGWKQMHARVEALESDWECVVTSPLKRCFDFAKTIAESHQLPLDVEPDFKEIGFGVWQGKRRDELDPASLAKFNQNPLAYTPANAEPLIEFNQRVLTTWDNLLQRLNQRNCLLVTHAGVIRAVVAALQQKPLHEFFKLKVPFAGVCQVSTTDENTLTYRLCF